MLLSSLQFSSCLTSREGSEAPQVTFVPNCTTVAVNGDHQETKQNHQNGRGRGSSDEVAICETPSLESSRFVFWSQILRSAYVLFVLDCALINPRRACAARVTVLGLCVRVSLSILAVRVTTQLMSDTQFC